MGPQQSHLDRDWDTQATAAAASIGTTTGLTRCPTDEDWYSIDGQPGDAIEIELSFSHAEGDINVYFWDSSATLLFTANSQSDDELISMTVPSSDTYAVQVEWGLPRQRLRNGPHRLLARGRRRR